MKIGIVGLGAVGSANKEGFARLGHEVFGHDVKLDTSLSVVLGSQLCFICVPTPSGNDGGCDTSIVENVIDDLCAAEYEGIIAVRSTTLPGFTQRVIEKYKNDKIAFVPEFLRERCALEDFIDNHKLLAIGSSNPSVVACIKEAHAHLPEEVVALSPTEAELLKYYNNVYASLRITFANVFYEICTKFGADYTAVKNAYVKTGKAKDMYLDVSADLRGYGGMCLPKDTSALANLVKSLNLDLHLIETIERDNKKFEATVFEGMRN